MEKLLLKALDAITSRVNLSCGLDHPNDKDAAIEMFQKLKKMGISLPAGEICKWAKQNGWETGDAKQLAAIALKIEEGKKVVVKNGPSWSEDILEKIMMD